MQEFCGSWNLHPLRTEHNWSAKKIWLNGVIDPANRGLACIRDICDPLPDDVDNFGVDGEGPLPLHDDLEGVEILITSVPLTSRQLDELSVVVDCQSGLWNRYISSSSRFSL